MYSRDRGANAKAVLSLGHSSGVGIPWVPREQPHYSPAASRAVCTAARARLPLLSPESKSRYGAGGPDYFSRSGQACARGAVMFVKTKSFQNI